MKEEKKTDMNLIVVVQTEKMCHYSHDDFYVFDYVDRIKKTTTSVCHPSLCLSHDQIIMM